MSESPQTLISDLSPKITQQLDELDVVDGNHLDFENGDGWFTYFLDGDIQFYIVVVGKRKFYVDTQGHDYARYVGELI